MIFQWHKRISVTSAFLWVCIGILTIGSIALSSIGLIINVIMGFVFMLIGIMLYLRGNYLSKFTESISLDSRKDQNLKRFLVLELIISSGFGLLGGVILAAGIFRVFVEGYAIFG